MTIKISDLRSKVKEVEKKLKVQNKKLLQDDPDEKKISEEETLIIKAAVKSLQEQQLLLLSSINELVPAYTEAWEDTCKAEAETNGDRMRFSECAESVKWFNMECPRTRDDSSCACTLRRWSYIDPIPECTVLHCGLPSRKCTSVCCRFFDCCFSLSFGESKNKMEYQPEEIMKDIFSGFGDIENSSTDRFETVLYDYFERVDHFPDMERDELDRNLDELTEIMRNALIMCGVEVPSEYRSRIRSNARFALIDNISQSSAEDLPIQFHAHYRRLFAEKAFKQKAKEVEEAAAKAFKQKAKEVEEAAAKAAAEAAAEEEED